jgi:soluble lytic murein transglycosylase-like protein
VLDKLPDDIAEIPEVEVRKVRKRSFSKVSWALAIFFILISAGLTFVIIALSNKMNQEILDIKKVQDEQFIRHTETNQFLLSTIDWSSRRAQLILFMRDQIVAQWEKSGMEVNFDEAYKIAETNLRECENYSYIDPFFILATQCIESKFNKKATSPVGAKGLNQFMSSTGRLLAVYYNMEYNDSLLYNIEVSTKFAVKLFDILYAQYNGWDIALADYNGGPWQAFYYKNDKKRMASETKKYIPDVLNKKKQYDTLFVKYRMDEMIKNSLAGEMKDSKLAYK